MMFSFFFSKLLQIVLGDKSEQKAFKYTGITCFNPGSFANECTFAAYLLAPRRLSFLH
jgi:DNA polymerase epsilon subunit 2